MATIHPTAIVETGAELGEGVNIGALAYIGPRVRLGAGCRIHHHATVEGNTVLGADNEVFPYAFVGGRTQDKKYRGGEPEIVVGDRNIFREYCSVHPATFEEDRTVIGSDNLFCAYCHIGHESTVGSHTVFSNNATLGGHVVVGDRVVIGGLTAVHQFCRIGAGAILGGCSKVVQDVLPYMMTAGHPATHRSVNKVGMERAGFDNARIGLVRKAFKLIFRSGLNHSDAIDRLRQGELGRDPVLEEIVAAYDASERGLA